MCKACNHECCDTDHLAECGCQDCFCEDCWSGWEVAGGRLFDGWYLMKATLQERDPGDEQQIVPALLTLAVGSIVEKEV